MKVFTYGQYIKSIHMFRLHAIMQLAEESEKYRLEEEKKKDFHDNLVENILQDKKEARQLINQFVEPREKIKEELVSYNNCYRMKKDRTEEIDFVYRLKNQDIFFLIIHQPIVDDKISYRVLNRCLDIMREWTKNRKMGRNNNYPIIVPIIIYTGNQKWKQIKNFYIEERYKIDIEYNLIDINKFSKQVLLRKDSIFAYAMFLEKAKNDEELIKSIEKIIKVTKNKEKLKELANQVHFLLDHILEKKTQQEWAEKIERKVGEKVMSTLIERLKESQKKCIEQGRKESQKEIMKNMLDQKFDENMILKITKIQKEELEKMKKELTIVN